MIGKGKPLRHRICDATSHVRGGFGIPQRFPAKWYMLFSGRVFMDIGNLPYDRHLTERAQALRREMTPQERKLWYQFLRQYPVKVYRQRVIDHFIADFYCAKAKLVIELDGSQHYTEQGKCRDAERTAILEAYGVQVLRFSNRDIRVHFEGVCMTIHHTVLARMDELSDAITEP